MSEEPVDRRGLFRDLFRQASGAIVPAIGARLGPLVPQEPAEGERAAHRTASVEELLSAAADLGLDGRAKAIEGLARRSLRLIPAVDATGRRVRFGGTALMDEEREWPSWQGRALTLLAQVEAGEGLGRLLFFWDVLGRPSGCLAAHRGSAQVLLCDDSRILPVDGPALPAGGLPGQLAVELVIPPAASDAVAELGLAPPERDAWEALREELASLQGTGPAHRVGEVFRVVHRILGYPDCGSAEMELTYELASAGEDVIEGRAHMHPRAAQLEAPAARWELLAQVSGDGKLGWPWVAQRVYFWVDREALAAGNLDQVWAIAR